MKNQKEWERIIERRKWNRGRILFLAVSMLLLCGLSLLGEKGQTDIAAANRGTQTKPVGDACWERVEQEGFPCIVVDEQGNIVGTRRGELLQKVVLDYTASNGNLGREFQNYQVQADAFSACPNLKTLVLPYQNASKYRGVIEYIDPHAFRGCSGDLVVYCEKESYVWTRLQELGITVKEFPDENWDLAGEDRDALKKIQDRMDAEESVDVLTDQELKQLYGEPFFIMAESGQVLHAICESLGWYISPGRKFYLPADAHTLAGAFPQYPMEDQSVMIPKNIVVVGEASFMCCQLSAITFEEGSSLQTIGSHAFMQDNFTEISLPEGLLEIGQRAFSDCRNLAEITIPESVRTLGSQSFSLCDSLERVVILNPDISFGEDVFDDEIINPELSDDEIDLDNPESNFIPNNRLTIVCHKGSNAEKYAMEHELQVEYLE